MSAPNISNADMLEIQLRKWIGKGRVHNVKLRPAYSHPSLPAGETVIAEVIDRSAQGLFFTGSGFTLSGHGFIRYDDIVATGRLFSGPHGFRARREPEDYRRIELSLRGGTSVTISDVEQAVFPLFQFVQWMIKRRQHAS